MSSSRWIEGVVHMQFVLLCKETREFGICSSVSHVGLLVLWLHRNSKLFDDDFVERESTRERVERMVADISLSLSKDRAAAATTNRTLLRIISWSKPEEGWVKCILGLAHNIGWCSVVEAHGSWDTRINKSDRSKAVLENYEEGEKYAEHGLRKFLRTRPPEIMPAVNHFFSRNE
ncbi:hypothetical protein V6N12_057140 [Hibiscus sabdariffa]|uniref:Uncharacterized protein n=1 Tax=Hibiscus sabdariffa TaxID=183260 RepID=A0ABR2AUY9_9ROSI